MLARDGSHLLTNNYVVDETATRLRNGIGPAAALGFRQMLLDAVAARRLRITWIDEKAEAEREVARGGRAWTETNLGGSRAGGARALTAVARRSLIAKVLLDTPHGAAQRA